MIDIDCIDQSVEIEDTLVSFIDLLILIFTENWFHANSKFVNSWVAIEGRRIKQLYHF